MALSSPASRLEPGGEGQQSNVASLFDSASQLALVRRADSGQAPRNDLAALGYELLQQANFAVRDRIDLLGAELANLLAAKELSSAAASSAGTRRTSAARWTRAGAMSAGVTRA